ncbi:HhH-GPD-type base excision DNA repair protein [Nesterenkonia marinintestina]|uniref:HhH-GPD-type base excision DNA repair protein n=1 Tax=Nesterenkonia marinintestina TaxID=2979865 RepID=UPI0036F3EA6B
MVSVTTLYLAADETADTLLAEDPFALLTGMLLDQQVTMESAFAGPAKLAARLDEFTPQAVAGMDPEALTEAFREKPAVHRFPGSMAGRVQDLARTVTEDYDGDAAGIWTHGEPDGPEVLRRLKALPGFGEQKARIFLALLGKQCGVDVDGWREAAGEYGRDGAMISAADVVDAATLAEVRENKKARKAAAKKK